MMKLYFHPMSHNSRRARSVALHVGAAHETIVVDVPTGAHKKPEFLKINPMGMIPVIDDDGFTLGESTAIGIYLAEKTKSEILPTDLKARAEVMGWLSWDQCHWNPTCSTVIFERVFKKMFGGTTDEKAVEVALEKFNRYAAVLDARLADRDFIGGAKVTLADFACASALTMAVPAKLPLESYKNITRWFAQMDTVPGWKESAPQPIG
jgi:glutathione S-transferase